MPVRVFTSRSQSYAASTARSQIAANAKNPNVSLHHTLSLPIDGEDRKREEKERERERGKKQGRGRNMEKQPSSRRLGLDLGSQTLKCKIVH